MGDLMNTPRGLNFWMVLALCVGNMVGSGIYLLPATLAPLGTNQLLGWMVTIAGATALAATFAFKMATLATPTKPAAARTPRSAAAAFPSCDWC